MKNLGVAMVGGHGAREKDDFYATPPAAIEALKLSGAFMGWPMEVWEPACGDGALARRLDEYFPEVIATDLLDRGYGIVGIDFLSCARPLAPAIVTNPPFKLAAEFIQHAHKLGVGYLALLLKSQFWHAAARRGLFYEWPPAVEYKLTWRLDFTGAGAPTMDCSWFVWLPGCHGCRVELLPRPE